VIGGFSPEQCLASSRVAAAEAFVIRLEDFYALRVSSMCRPTSKMAVEIPYTAS